MHKQWVERERERERGEEEEVGRGMRTAYFNSPTTSRFRDGCLN